MDSLQSFLAMGDHGFYVWTAYGGSALVLALLVWVPIRRRRQFLNRERRRLKHAS